MKKGSVFFRKLNCGINNKIKKKKSIDKENLHLFLKF